MIVKGILYLAEGYLHISHDLTLTQQLEVYDGKDIVLKINGEEVANGIAKIVWAGNKWEIPIIVDTFEVDRKIIDFNKYLTQEIQISVESK